MSNAKLHSVWRGGKAANLLIRNVRVIDPSQKLDQLRDVLIRKGKIEELAAPNTIDSTDLDVDVIEGEGLHLFPGFVDPHVHLRTPGQEHKENIVTGTQAAAKGGYVSLVAMPNTSPAIDNATVLAALYEQSRKEAVIPLSFSAAVTVGQLGEQLTEMAELADRGVACFTDDGRPIVHAGILRKALQYQRIAGGLVIALHEEDPSLSAGGAMHEGIVSTELGIAGIPGISESTMILRDIAIAGNEQGRIHIQHLSSADSVRAIADGKAQKVHVTAEVSPHHLALTETAVKTMNTSMKMNPPLRTETDRQALIEGLKTNVIDCIATDHAPHAADEKAVPFEQAPMGTTGLESAFAVLYTEFVKPGIFSLPFLVKKMSSSAARVVDLPEPLCVPNHLADCVLIDLKKEWTIGRCGYQSRSSNCCFDGRSVYGEALLTIARGVIVYQEGQQ